MAITKEEARAELERRKSFSISQPTIEPTSEPEQPKNLSISKEQAQQELDRRSQINQDVDKYGSIEQARPLEQAYPSIGQVVGGLGGGVVGGIVGQPTLGAAVGGTAGRTVGIVEQEKQKMLRNEPEKAKLIKGVDIASKFAFPTAPILNSIATGVVTVAQLDKDTKRKLGKEVLKTGAIEAVAGGAGKLISSFSSAIGKGVMNEVLGKRVAERGQERGWKTLLDKKFYKGRVPKAIAQRSDKFFNKLSGATGRGVQEAIETTAKKEPSKSLINISEVKNEIRKILPQSGDPADLLESFAPKAQKDRIRLITDKVLKQKGDIRRVDNLWKLRKEIDTDIYKQRWTDESLAYLQKLRGSLNKPIKGASPEIAEAFDKYAFVKKAEGNLYKKFEAVKGSGEIYASNLEKYVKNLLSTNNDETIRMLKDLDKFNKADDRVVEELLDLAAAESLDKGIPDISMFGKIVGGMFGGRKILPRVARVVQHPVTKQTARLAGRGAVTSFSESQAEKEDL